MVEKRITTEKPMKITIEQNRTNPKELTITATNSLCKIKRNENSNVKIYQLTILKIKVK